MSPPMPYAGDDGKSPDEMDLEDKLKELADLLKIPPVEFGKFGPTQRGLAAVTEAIRFLTALQTYVNPIGTSDTP